MQHGRFFMSKVWEFFENMNEAVYASDVDTYELLYLIKRPEICFSLRMSLIIKEKLAMRSCSNVLPPVPCVPTTA